MIGGRGCGPLSHSGRGWGLGSGLGCGRGSGLGCGRGSGRGPLSQPGRGCGLGGSGGLLSLCQGQRNAITAPGFSIPTLL